jgi:integrase
MTDMPRPRPPYLSREVTRHGTAVWYVRRNGKRIRLGAEFGTPEFDAEYQAAMAGAVTSKRAAAAGTLAWLIDRYREAHAWTSLSTVTRQQRERFLKHILESAGSKPIAAITTAAIKAGCERRSNTPAQARHFLETLRGLFRWAHQAQLVKVNPTADVKMLRERNSGYRPWTEDDVLAYQGRWPMGTRQRVWLDVLLYTGLRRGDAVRFGRQHVRDGVMAIKTEKTDTPVTLPILPALSNTLSAGPCGDLAFISGSRGQPMATKTFSNEFQKACRAAGVPGSAHGVRKLAAIRVAHAGASVPQMNAVFGWTGAKMALHYIEAANRRHLAMEAMSKLANEKQTSIVAP